MAIYRIRDLGGTGVIADTSGFNIPPNAFTSSMNARFFNKKVEKIGGNQKIFSKNIPNKAILAICQRPNIDQIVYGTSDALYICDGVNHENASPKEVDTFPNPITGGNTFGENNITSLVSITQISAGDRHTLCLSSSGNVTSVGDTAGGKANVSSWGNITKVSAGREHSVGLKSNKVVVAVGNNGYGQCNVNSWSNIVDISAGSYHTVGVKEDGTVVAVGRNTNGQCNTGGLFTVIKAAAGSRHTVVLKADGTVSAIGDNALGQCNVSSWTNIVDIDVGWEHTVGLKADGTVVATGSNSVLQCEVSAWSSINAITVGAFHTVGIKTDKTVVATGSNVDGQCNVSTFGNVRILSAGLENTVGFKNTPSTTSFNVDTLNSWYYDYLSNSVIYTSKYANPMGLLPNNSSFIELPGWGKPNKESATIHNWKTPVIRTFKDYLVALSMVEDGVDYSQRIRWSDISYVNALPSNWHHDDPNTDGGFVDLSDSVGSIVDGVVLSDKFIVYTDKETYIMNYVGGDFIFSFTKLFSDSGILSKGCACEFEGKHFVITQDDIIVHNGSSKQSVATSKVKDYLLNAIGGVNPQATKVFPYPKRKEIWIQYVASGAGSSSDPLDPYGFACNMAAIYNYEFDTWYFTELPNVFDINIVDQVDADTRSWEDYSTVGQDEWDALFRASETWNINRQTFNNQVLVSGSKDCLIYGLDIGTTFNYINNSVEYSRPVVTTLEKLNIDFDDVVEDIGRHKFITAMYPQVSGKGTLTFYIGGSNNPNEDVTWDMTYPYIINDDVKVDCFTNYRYPALKVIDSEEGSWSFSNLDITFVIEGTR